jgi:hypothetical protein
VHITVLQPADFAFTGLCKKVWRHRSRFRPSIVECIREAGALREGSGCVLGGGEGSWDRAGSGVGGGRSGLMEGGVSC